jgi:8-oxo-dGTP diphosphatase
MAAPAHRFCPLCAGGLTPRILAPGGPARLVCSACRHVHHHDPRLAVGTIATFEGGLVLVQRDRDPARGKWVIPGGFVERGESLEVVAGREALGQTGLRVGLLGILNVYSFSPHEVVTVIYAGDTLEGALAGDGASPPIQAFSPELLPWEDLAFQSTQAALRDYLRRYFPRVRLPRSEAPS